jgi:O-methyltransferase
MAKYIFYACTGEQGVRYAAELCKHVNSEQSSINQLLDDCGVVAFCDRAPELSGTQYLGREVISPKELKNREFDKIYILSSMSVDDIFTDLTEKYDIPADKIERAHIDFTNRTRERFVTFVANEAKKRGVDGSVAEGGVFKGDFAKVINKNFPDSKLYLFDTFSGFDDRDFNNDNAFKSNYNTHSHLVDTSVDIVLKKLPFPKNAIIRKGYFPEITVGDEQLAQERFLFVNLDFDLYSPIKAGLEFFFPKLVDGGIILIHDYFNSNFEADKAVDEFCAEHRVYPISIGDTLSVAVTKQ